MFIENIRFYFNFSCWDSFKFGICIMLVTASNVVSFYRLATVLYKANPTGEKKQIHRF